MLVLACFGARAVQACKLGVPPRHLSDESRRATDSQPPRLTSAPGLQVQRIDMGNGWGGSASSCDGQGFIRINVAVSDDQTPMTECGFRLSLVSGTLPASLHFPTHDVRAVDGVISLP